MEPVERVKRTLAYKGRIIEVYKDNVRFSDGRESVWDYIDHVGAAAVVPVTEEGKIILVKQYRNALDRFTYELPAGKRDAADEPMEVCAARELEEETGYAAGKLLPLITVNTTVAFCNEKIGIFAATELKKTAQHLDADEEIELYEFTPAELLDLIRCQKMTDSKTVAGILAYLQFFGA